ncbi:hypothetical protein [uncultured Mediterranean phage uvDeep-CGR2-KM18-C74]|nr:hypothetical protein [uncultured Mediterranean phage uvDeep-CGR2-KM18-C74]
MNPEDDLIRCEMCEDWWCEMHKVHFYDCSCVLSYWLDEIADGPEVTTTSHD